MGRTTYTVSRPAFVVDPASIVRNSGRQIDWAAIPETYRQGVKTHTVTVGANAAADATSLTVSALSQPLSAGTLLDFGGKKLARVSAYAAAGATSVAVDALGVAIASADVATVIYDKGGAKMLPAGTVVGDLAGNGKLRPRVVTTNPAIGVLETAAVEGDPSASLSGYGVIIGGALYENLLPEATGTPKVLATAVKTELNANGTGFAFEQFSDSRAS
jgi:hypothetical protein